MQIAVYCIVFLLALRLVVQLQLMFRLRRIAVPLRPIGLLAREELLPHEARILAAAEVELLECGFSFSHAETFRRFENAVVCDQRRAVYLDSERMLCVLLGLSLTPERSRPVERAIFSVLSDGRTCLTTDSPGIFALGRSEKLLLFVQGANSFGQLLDAHRKGAAGAAAASGWSLLPGDTDGVLEIENQIVQLFLSELLADGRLVEDGSGCAIPRFWTAFRAGTSLLPEPRDAEPEDSAKEKPMQQLPLEAEVAAYRLLRQIQEKASIERGAKVLLFCITAVLFAASFSRLLSWQSICILGAVLLFHECGHIAGMRYFGYRDLRILFLPFLGAVALGRRRNAGVTERVIVALLGPVPGILLGFFCSALFHHLDIGDKPVCSEIVWTLLGLNFFNLLPIVPLDGGQVLHALIFSRKPLIEAIFTLTGAVLLGMGALVWGQPILAFVAILILISAKDQVRRSRLLMSLRKKLSATDRRIEDEQRTAFAVYEHMAEQGYRDLPFQQKYQIADYLVCNAHVPAPGWGRSLALGLLYAISLSLLPSYLLTSYLLRQEGNEPRILRSEDFPSPPFEQPPPEKNQPELISI
jgi:Zn-dependent protease